jgi:hypothetical protein
VPSERPDAAPGVGSGPMQHVILQFESSYPVASVSSSIYPPVLWGRPMLRTAGLVLYFLFFSFLGSDALLVFNTVSI